jgi:hypothetical protein
MEKNSKKENNRSWSYRFMNNWLLPIEVVLLIIVLVYSILNFQRTMELRKSIKNDNLKFHKEHTQQSE